MYKHSNKTTIMILKIIKIIKFSFQFLSLIRLLSNFIIIIPNKNKPTFNKTINYQKNIEQFQKQGYYIHFQKNQIIIKIQKGNYTPQNSFKPRFLTRNLIIIIVNKINKIFPLVTSEIIQNSHTCPVEKLEPNIKEVNREILLYNDKCNNHLKKNK